MTAGKRGSSTLETEQYQYLRSASLIPSKQAVIGMFAVIFHVGLLIHHHHPHLPPLSATLIILSKHLNIVHDTAVRRVSYSPYTSTNGFRTVRVRAHTHKHQENHLKREGFFSRFDTVTLPPTSVSPKEYNPIIYSDCAKSKRAFFRRREGGREKRETHVVLK